ncbi:MAG: tryptophan--tRNA ligase [Micrococcales bacterium]|nr:tryptophan--tRNA ligase [Micrococcales bacterium]
MVPVPADRRRVFSGIQPTADSLHIGNYLGAVRNWVTLQETHDCVYSVVDLHALTVNPNPADILRRTRVTAAQLLAAGVDPDRSILFVQSHVSEHAELTWLLNCVTGFGEAGRMTQFKDKTQKQGSEGANVGLFDYPILQAADILLYDAHAVPVGEDQRQHLELSRDIAIRLNSRLGEGTAIVPEALITAATAKIYDLQNPGAKMSKTGSPTGILELLDEPKVLAKRVKSAVTDTETTIRFDPENKPGVSNLLSIYGALTNRAPGDIAAEYEGKMYGHLKVDLAEVVVETFRPIREGAQALLADPDELDRILARGAERAREIAGPVFRRIASRFGLLAPGTPGTPCTPGTGARSTGAR